MPVLKSDADRAREILQDYHSRLTEPTDKSLRKSIERLTHIFTSDLFKALLDIQEYYEVTLQNEGRTEHDRNQEWMDKHGFSADVRAQRSDIVESPPAHDAQMVEVAPSPALNAVEVTLTDIPRPTKAPPPPPQSQPQPTYHVQGDTGEMVVDHHQIQPMEVVWDEEVILLNRGESGYGFSIAGGVDNPHIEGDPSIYVTRVVPGGTSAIDGRLQLDDLIVMVNRVDVTAVTHDEAVGALKNAGNTLELVVRRRRLPNGGIIPPNTSIDGLTPGMGNMNLEVQQPQYLEIELWKQGRGLGFSIAGGIGNEHIEGDPGIFVTRVIENGCAYADGRMEIGDRLVAVDDTSLENITHEDAVDILKATGEHVRLLLLKESHLHPRMDMEGGGMMQGQMYANVGPAPEMHVSISGGVEGGDKGKKSFGLFKKKKK